MRSGVVVVMGDVHKQRMRQPATNHVVQRRLHERGPEQLSIVWPLGRSGGALPRRPVRRPEPAGRRWASGT
jgi:hypothetical protein